MMTTGRMSATWQQFLCLWVKEIEANNLQHDLMKVFIAINVLGFTDRINLILK